MKWFERWRISNQIDEHLRIVAAIAASMYFVDGMMDSLMDCSPNKNPLMPANMLDWPANNDVVMPDLGLSMSNLDLPNLRFWKHGITWQNSPRTYYIQNVGQNWNWTLTICRRRRWIIGAVWWIVWHRCRWLIVWTWWWICWRCTWWTVTIWWHSWIAWRSRWSDMWWWPSRW